MAERFVDYSLRFKADQGSSRAFDDASRKAKKLEQDANKAGQAVRAATSGKPAAGGAGGGLTYGTGSQLVLDAPGAEGRGALGALRAGLAIAASLAIAERAIQGATKAINISNNPTLTEFQKDQGLKRLVPFVDSWINFVEALGGYTEKVRAMNAATAKAMVELQIDTAATAQKRQARTAYEELEADVAGTRDTDAVAGAVRAARMKAEAASRELAEARAAAEAADAEALARRTDLDRPYRKRELDMSKAEDRAQFEREQWGFTQEAHDKNLDLIQKTSAAVEALAKQDVARKRLLEAQNNELVKMQAAERAHLEMVKAGVAAAQERAKAEAAVVAEKKKAALESERDRVAGAAATFAQLRPEERRMAADLAEQARRRGLDAMSDMERDLLRRSGAEKPFVEAAGEKLLDDADFKRMLQAMGQRNHQEIMAELEKVKPEVYVDVTMNVNADEIADALLRKAKLRQQDIDVTIEQNQKAQKVLEELRKRQENLLGKQ